MHRYLQNTFVRNLEGPLLLETFFVSAVASILVIRAYLEMTGYPQIGGGGLHIAHMLWGGLGMLVALIIMLGFITRPAAHLAAFVGGIGFGAFVDELGKFITSDNNYFFQPTVALLYIVFVVLFLVFRLIRSRQVSQREYLVNAADMLKEVITQDLDEHEKQRALEYLDKADQRDPVVLALRGFFADIEPLQRRPGVVERGRLLLRSVYERLTRWRWFQPLIIGIFVVDAIGSVAQWFLITVAASNQTLLADLQAVTTVEWIQSGSLTASSLLVIAGVMVLRFSFRRGLLLIKGSILISIFITQVFTFYLDQFAALGSLALDVALLLALDYMLEQHPPGTRQPAPPTLQPLAA